MCRAGTRSLLASARVASALSQVGASNGEAAARHVGAAAVDLDLAAREAEALARRRIRCDVDDRIRVTPSRRLRRAA